MSLSTTTFKLSGMHCASCAMNIDFMLEDLEGVEESNTNYAKQESTVQFNSQKIDHEKIISAINKLGYQVK